MKRISPHLIAIAAGAILIALAAVSFSPVPAAAQMSPEQACSGDAQRLCGQFIPDRERTGACMKRQVRSLSPACAAFFKPAKPARRSTRYRRR